jgi:hypothetical protein
VTRALAALLLTALAPGCWTSSTPAQPPVHTDTHVEIKAPPVPPVDTTPLELIVTEGTPSLLPDGTTVDVRGVMYAHLTNGGNLSAATLTFALGTDVAEASLSRRGDEAEADRWKPALAWEVRLEYADPYHQPSTASITVRRRSP